MPGLEWKGGLQAQLRIYSVSEVINRAQDQWREEKRYSSVDIKALVNLVTVMPRP